jgi:4-amino-4-deoxy-L-arabinose transferase-like glycosyltransferase
VRAALDHDSHAAAGAPAHTQALLWGALGLVLAVRILSLWLNATDLFFDEAQYWSWSLEPAFGYYSKPPLIAWVISAATATCGSSEFCIRLPAPIFHSATALVIYMIGRRLYDPAVGLWSALVFVTLPGVSVSSGIISTDVPLLFFWALALWGFLELLETRSWWPAVLLGLGMGLGLNAKYAMVFFPLSMLAAMAFLPGSRALLRDPRLYAGYAMGAVLIVPNIAWNLSNGFATLAHTADNAKWGGSLLNVGKGFEFLGAQFGVFGPILFAALGWITWQAWRGRLSERERMLLAFSLPVIAVITAQAFVSRAHANWAATAYVAASVLVAARLMRSARGWLTAAIALHVLLACALGLATWQAGRFRLPFAGDPLARMLGWRAMAETARGALDEARQQGRPFAAVITDDRSLTAELLYYLRPDPTAVLAWRNAGRPLDHYELTRPYRGGTGPVLLISVRADPGLVTRHFDRVEPLAERQIAAGTAETRRIRLFSLSGFRLNSPSKESH